MKLSDLSQMGQKPIYFFSYGMLTDPALMPDAEFVGRATLANYELEMRLFANIIPSSGYMFGSLWKLTPEQLADLDEVEGYPTFYGRKSVSVKSGTKTYTAQVYIMTPESSAELAGMKPSEHYINKLARGYSHAGIPLSQIKNAK